MPEHNPEERIIIIAPVGQDAAALAAALAEHGFGSHICSGLIELCDEISGGAGALVLTEEALQVPQLPNLLQWLKSQPPWSELPLIILTKGGESRWEKLLDLTVAAAGSLTVLERPLASTTLLRSVEVALRSRRRQYQVRDLLTQLAEARAISEQHSLHLEKVVEERTRDLRSTNEQLEAFVYSIAHDLRAPLRSMSGYSQLLVDDYAAGLDASARHLLNRIQASAEFMDKLLLDLLAFGRIARVQIQLVPVQVRNAWDTALFQCAMQIEQTHARVTTVEPLLTVLAHEATLGQCLANLLSNALKFVKPGEPPEIVFWSERQGDRVRMLLRDQGIGIPADQHERVFRVFERLHGSRYQGTGIGLSIVRKGVERMGGTMGLESEPGKGSCFWIELPRVG